MATAIASPAASRKLRSRTKWPTPEGPTPRPTGMPAFRGSIDASLLGFGDFGSDSVEERALRGQLRMPRQQRLCDFVGLEQQILALVWRRRVDASPEVALRAGGVEVGEAHQRQTAALPPVLLRVAPLSLFVSAERVRVLAREEQRVPEVVVAEDERGIDRAHAPQRRFGFVESSEL